MSNDQPTTKKRTLNAADNQDSRGTVVRTSGAGSGVVVPPPIDPRVVGHNLPSRESRLIDERAETQVATTAWLFFARGAKQGQLLELTTDYIPFGLTNDHPITIGDGAIDNLQTAIVKRDGDWFLCDLKSPAGISLNDGLLGVDVPGPHKLGDGDRITIGNTLLIFKKV